MPSMLDILLPEKYQHRAREAGRTARENLKEDLKRGKKRYRKKARDASRSYRRSAGRAFKHSHDPDEFDKRLIAGNSSGSAWDMVWGPGHF